MTTPAPPAHPTKRPRDLRAVVGLAVCALDVGQLIPLGCWRLPVVCPAASDLAAHFRALPRIPRRPGHTDRFKETR
jgi:hypothetical protein